MKTREDAPESRVERWLAALDRRHLAHLTPSEAARALRALSSCYVERRSRLPEGGALNSAGKRAAFALFYAPAHFLVTREILRALGTAAATASRIHDLGCGTGAAGAAWALTVPGARISGVDRNAWAVAEANWTYRQLGIPGRAAQVDVARARIPVAPDAGVLAAFTVNELPDQTRAAILPRLLEAHAAGAAVLIIEPIARRMAPWWATWAAAFTAAGGRADEWRFPVSLPTRQYQLARAAGLNPRELTARTLFLPGRGRSGR
jgi:hypothetical protein